METLYHSTRSSDELVTSKQAILAGIAPDGGLYVSDQLGANKVNLTRIAGQGYHATARDVLGALLSDYTDDEVRSGLNIVLDNIQDPGNLGTIMRLADWYGIRNIFASKSTVDVYNHKVVQATMGAISRVKVHYCDLDFFLDDYDDMPVMGTFLDGDNIYGAKLPEGGAFVIFGNEGQGISPKIAAHVTQRLHIPAMPRKGEHSESLNVGIAAAITISELRRNHLIK